MFIIGTIATKEYILTIKTWTTDRDSDFNERKSTELFDLSKLITFQFVKIISSSHLSNFFFFFFWLTQMLIFTVTFSFKSPLIIELKKKKIKIASSSHDSSCF